MLIIGITGTLGAGKGTIVQYLKEKEGFIHYSVRGFLLEEIARRCLTPNRDSMTSVANDLRAQNGPSFIIDELYNKAVIRREDCVIESIRTPGEIYSLREKGHFYLFAVDADPAIRYQRIRLRQSETDSISYETFLENENREYTTCDPNKQNLKKCIELSDFTFNNNGTIEQLNNNIKIVIKKIKTSDDI